LNAAREAGELERALNNLQTSNRASVRVPETEQENQKVQIATDRARAAIAAAVREANEGSSDANMLDQARQAAADAAEELGRAAEQLENAKRAAAKQIEQYNPQPEGDEAKANAKIRRQVNQRRVSTLESRMLSEQIRGLRSRREIFRAAEREAGFRSSAAEKQTRQAETKIKQLQQQVQAEKNRDKVDQQNIERLEEEIQKQEASLEAAKKLLSEADKTRDWAKARQKAMEQDLGQVGRDRMRKMESDNPGAEVSERLAERALKQADDLADNLRQLANGKSPTPDRLDPKRAQNASDRQDSVADAVDRAVGDLSRAARHEDRLDRPESAATLQAAADASAQRTTPPIDAASDVLRRASQSPNQASSKSPKQASGQETAPGDSPAGDARSSEKAQGEQAQGEKAQGESGSPQNRTAQAEAAIREAAEQLRPLGEAAAQPAGDRQSGGQPSSNQQNGDPQGGSQQSGDQQGGSQQSGDQQSGSQSSSSGRNIGDEQGEASRQKARQLDELDRALAQQRQSMNQAGESSQGQSQSGGAQQDQQGGQGQSQSQSAGSQAQGSQAQGSQADGSQSSGSQPNGQPQNGGSAQGGNPSGPTAGDLSPTLASAMGGKQQNAAKTRQQRMQNNADGEGDSSGDAPQTSNAGDSDQSGSPGADEMPGGKPMSIEGIERLGSNWGSLRQKTNEDAAESADLQVPAQYRKELEAYFREVARRGVAAPKTDD
ncbi:MAG: hypothetical protein AAF958_14710, partial [Planctomycetota bacterium]